MTDKFINWVIAFAMAVIVVGFSVFAFAFIAWEYFE